MLQENSKTKNDDEIGYRLRSKGIEKNPFID